MAEHEEKLESPKSSLEENPIKQESLKLKLSDEQKSKLENMVILNWESSDAARTKWLTDKKEGLDLYWGIRKSKDFPFKNCANLHVPLIRTIKDTLFSNLVGSLNLEAPCNTLAQCSEDVAKARKTEKLLNWQFSTQVNYSDLTDKLIDSALIMGLGVAKVRYVIERREGKKVYDGLKVDVIPPEKFLIPADASDEFPDNWDYCIQEISLSKSDIRKRIASNSYDDPKIDLDKLGAVESPSDKILENLRSFYSGIDSDTDAENAIKVTKPKSHVTILEWYGNFDYNDDGIEEPIMAVIILEARKIIKAVKWEGPRPFRLIEALPILHKPTGESVPDLLRKINEELNTIHNQRVDAVTIRNIPWGFFDPMAGFNPSELHLVPGLLVPTNGPPSQAVYFPSMQLSMPEMYREEEALFLYAERMLGAGANVQGILQPKRISATEVASIDRRSGIRFLTLFNRIKKGLKGIFDLALYLDQQYMPPEIQVRVTGLDSSEPLFSTISREDVIGKFDVLVNGNSIVDEQAEKQEQLQLYQLGIANPLIASDPMALYELTKDTFIKLGAKKIDSYLRLPEDFVPKSTKEEHNLFLQEEDVKPNRTENVEVHLSEHGSFINSDNFNLLSDKGRHLALKHYMDTRRMKQLLEMQKKMEQLQMLNSQILQTQVTGEIPGTTQQEGKPSNGQQQT